MKTLKMLINCQDYNVLVENLDMSMLEWFEETLEDWDIYKIRVDDEIDELYHVDGKLFSSDVIRWYSGAISTKDLIDEYKQ